MRVSQGNPFDCVSEPQKIHILFHTDSFIEEILQDNISFIKLTKISQSDIINIVFTPTDNNLVSTKLLGFKLDLATYRISNKNVEILSNFLNAIISGETDERLLKNYNLKNNINLYDEMTYGQGYFHYFITKYGKNGVKIENILDILQSYFVEHKIFKSFDSFDLDESGYFNSKVADQAINFKLRIIELHCIKETKLKDYDLIINLSQSLSDRLSLLFKALIKVKYSNYKSHNNISSHDLMYHFSYLIILFTGCLDNLAWILNYIYRLEFSLYNETKNRVRLQKQYKKSKDEQPFYQKLKFANTDIHNYLLSEKVSSLIDCIYPIRDTLQHREFIKPLFVDNKINRHILFELPKEVKSELETAFSIDDFGFEQEISSLMGRDFYDIYGFSILLHSKFVDIIDSTFKKVIISQIVKLSKSEQAEIEKNKINFYNNPLGPLKLGSSIPY